MASPPKPAYEQDGYFLGRSFISSSRFADSNGLTSSILIKRKVESQPLPLEGRCWLQHTPSHPGPR